MDGELETEKERMQSTNNHEWIGVKIIKKGRRVMRKCKENEILIGIYRMRKRKGKSGWYRKRKKKEWKSEINK